MNHLEPNDSNDIQGPGIASHAKEVIEKYEKKKTTRAS
jgi:hypothetical protein